MATGLENPEEAAKFLREGIAANPNEPTLLFDLGHLFYAELRDFNRAEAIWTRALALIESVPAIDFRTRHRMRKKISVYLDALRDRSVEPVFPKTGGGY